MGASHSHRLFVHGHSLIHRLAPEVKIAATFAFACAVAVTPRRAVWAFGLHAVVWLGAVLVARLPLRFVATRLVVVVPFIAFAFLIPFVASGPRVEVAGVAVSMEGLWATWNVVAKALLGAGASIILAGTTEIPQLLGGLARLRVPATLTAIAMFMVRYLDLTTEELGRMRTAMTARGHDPRWLWQVRPMAAAAGALFIRSYERGERVHTAMISRGYTGTMPGLSAPVATPGQWLAAAALCAVAAATAATAAVWA